MAISFSLPGFRFHPTDVELVMYYLKRKLLGKKIVNAVAEVNILDFSPWDLPGKSSLKSGDLEWFFFCPNLKRSSSGSRCNRATKTGFWKATGKDRKVKYKDRIVASITTLIYHILDKGKGKRTDWVMHEYRMDDEQLANAGVIQDMYVLCKVFEKSGIGCKNGAQYGAPYDEEAWNDNGGSCSGSQVTIGPDVATNSLDNRQKDPATLNMAVSLTNPCSSTVVFSDNERQMDVVSSDDIILEEIASLLGVSTKDHNGNNDNEGVEAVNKEKGKSVVPNEDDVYADLVNFVDLDELKGAELSEFMTDGTEYTVSKLLSSDDLDKDLRDFYVD